jgi:predicted signal transduction protein with EAL and GGDEF domain
MSIERLPAFGHRWNTIADRCALAGGSDADVKVMEPAPDTDAQGALVIAERLRAHGRQTGTGQRRPTRRDHRHIGAAVCQSGGMDDLVSRADHALYAGKSAGRNNVQLSPPNPGDTPVRS